MFALSSESFPLALRLKTLDQVGSRVPDTLCTWVRIPCTVERKETTEVCHKERARTGSGLGQVLVCSLPTSPLEVSVLLTPYFLDC